MAGMRQICDRFHPACTCLVIPVVLLTPTEFGAAHSEAGVRTVHRLVHLGASAVFPYDHHLATGAYAPLTEVVVARSLPVGFELAQSQTERLALRRVRAQRRQLLDVAVLL